MAAGVLRSGHAVLVLETANRDRSSLTDIVAVEENVDQRDGISEINSFRRKTRSKALHEFKLHRQEKFLYVCDTLHMWEWDVRVLDIQEGVEGDHAPVCLAAEALRRRNFTGVQPVTV